jgi:hypothetical protein
MKQKTKTKIDKRMPKKDVYLLLGWRCWCSASTFAGGAGHRWVLSVRSLLWCELAADDGVFITATTPSRDTSCRNQAEGKNKTTHNFGIKHQKILSVI